MLPQQDIMLCLYDPLRSDRAGIKKRQCKSTDGKYDRSQNLQFTVLRRSERIIDIADTAMQITSTNADMSLL